MNWITRPPWHLFQNGAEATSLKQITGSNVFVTDPLVLQLLVLQQRTQEQVWEPSSEHPAPGSTLLCHCGLASWLLLESWGLVALMCPATSISLICKKMLLKDFWGLLGDMFLLINSKSVLIYICFMAQWACCWTLLLNTAASSSQGTEVRNCGGVFWEWPALTPCWQLLFSGFKEVRGAARQQCLHWCFDFSNYSRDNPSENSSHPAGSQPQFLPGQRGCDRSPCTLTAFTLWPLTR